MSRDKQIEKMAKILYEANGDSYDTTYQHDCEILAEVIYNAGYRKSTDVAEKIFAEIETSLMVSGCRDGSFFYEIRVEDYNHYKKKYIGKDTNVTTNTEEWE